ncbi:MAG: alginate export family protein [Candidatus Omnitrophica bacterium]|nr:alginate export family protein [Candidatus Omnitrophota bacterium]
MKRLLTLCVVLTAIALAAAPVFAEVQNVKVSGDVKTTGVYREGYTLLDETRLRSANASSTNNGIITQARVRVDADLTDNVSTTVRYLTQYYWDTQDHQGSAASSASADDVDLDLANVTLKEAFYGPLTMMIGRQPLRLGNGFVLGDPDTNTTDANSAADMAYGDLSLRKSFDAVRGILDYSPLTVNLFYSKINETDAVAGSESLDADLYGINGSFDFDSYNGEVEAYWLYMLDDSNTAPDPCDTTAIRDCFRPASKLNTIGVRGSMTPMDNLNVLGEFAVQRGDYDNISATKRDQDAYAYQVAGDYAFSDMSWAPVVRLGFTHYEGEPLDNDGDHEGWIPLFEDQTHGVVANYILGGVNGGQNSNADILNIGVTAEPMEDLTISVDFYNFWLDEKLVSADNTLLSGTNVTPGWYNLDEDSYYVNASDEIGYEVDLALNYDYTEDVKMGLSAGWFVAGKALEGSSGTSSNDEKAVQLLATLDVAF